LAKLPELEKSNATLFKDKANLLEQVGTLSIELKEAKDSCVKLNKELADLTEKLGNVQKENDTLKTENGDLNSKQAGLKAACADATQAAQAIYVLKAENEQLKAKVSKLQANQTAPLVSEDQAALKKKVQDLEEQEVKLKEALEEWTGLAKVCVGDEKSVGRWLIMCSARTKSTKICFLPTRSQSSSDRLLQTRRRRSRTFSSS
jgi:chromosome segregation ATPase